MEMGFKRGSIGHKEESEIEKNRDDKKGSIHYLSSVSIVVVLSS